VSKRISRKTERGERDGFGNLGNKITLKYIINFLITDWIYLDKDSVHWWPLLGIVLKMQPPLKRQKDRQAH